MSDSNVTIEQVRTDFNLFIEKMGTKSFWRLPMEKRDQWFAAACFAPIAFTAKTDAEEQEARQMLAHIKREYDARSFHVLFNPPTEDSPELAEK